jgi:drug/metabolite transporter (DMT)-like permease
MTPFRENLLGIGYLVACNLAFLCSDTLIKLIGSAIPLGEFITLRGIVVTLVLAPAVLVTGVWRELAQLRSQAVAWRTFGEAASAFTYLAALMHMPIANINTILQIVPLAITAAGALLLGEMVGWRRWTAIGVGFVGVLIVVRPGAEGFTVYSLLALASTFLIALRDISSRMMPRGLPALLVASVTGVAVGVCGPFYGLAMDETWTVPPLWALGLLCGSVVFLICGYLLSVAFMRHGDIGVVAPFRYAAIIWATIIGVVVFNELPDWPVYVGMAIIAASGIYTFHRERSRALLASKTASGEGV